MIQTPLQRARVAAAVVVANGFFELAKPLGNAPKAWLLTQMAADAIDRTLPSPMLQIWFQKKPPNVGDAQFLADNLPLLEALPPEHWPVRKVRSARWGEHTRIIKGLDEFLGAPEGRPKESARNRKSLAAFISLNDCILSATDLENMLDLLFSVS